MAFSAAVVLLLTGCTAPYPYAGYSYRIGLGDGHSFGLGLSSSLGSFPGWSHGIKQGWGTLGGAVVGGLAGSRFGGGTGKLVAVGAGTLLGSLFGSELGRSLDRADQLYARQAAVRAFIAPPGRTVIWSNPSSGHGGSITPLREGWSDAGHYCREYQQTITVGGHVASAYGIACQQPDGSWRIIA